MSKPLRTWVHKVVSDGTKWGPSLCLTSVLIIRSRGHFSGQSGVFAPTSVSSLWDKKQHLTQSWCAMGKHCPPEGPLSTALAVWMLVRIQYNDVVLIRYVLARSNGRLRDWGFISDSFLDHLDKKYMSFFLEQHTTIFFISANNL